MTAQEKETTDRTRRYDDEFDWEMRSAEEIEPAQQERDWLNLVGPIVAISMVLAAIYLAWNQAI